MQVAELEGSLEGLETERDFYFSKLRDIEILCQENEASPVLEQILDLMYATQVSAEGDGGLVSVCVWEEERGRGGGGAVSLKSTAIRM